MGILSRLLPARLRAAPALVEKATPNMSPVYERTSWWTIVQESFAGAFQADVKIDRDTVLTYFAVYACIDLIARDIGKLPLRLCEQDANGIWKEVRGVSPFWPVLRKPNHYQTRQKFIEHWMATKLIHGNAYMLKQRDARGIVTAMYVLDPLRVTPLVSTDGGVYYQLQDDYLAGLEEGQVTVPASEIIHDTMICLYHPLVGVSPISACGLAATHGLNIQKNSTRFFGNGSRPGGIITAPQRIDDAVAKRIKDYWDKNYTGENVGKVAVLGDGLKYEQLAVNAVDAQLIDQLKLSAEQVCSAFHVPAYKVGVGPMPTYQNAEILNQIYYTDCLQAMLESAEALLDYGLGLVDAKERVLGVEFDVDALLKMDTKSRVEAAKESIGSGAMAPNEARLRWLNLGPTKGGETPYLQQQNYSLAALAERDKMGPPSAAGTAAPAAPAAPAANDDADEDDAAEEAVRAFMETVAKHLPSVFADEDEVEQ